VAARNRADAEESGNRYLASDSGAGAVTLGGA
jgi:hypothetical protein